MSHATQYDAGAIISQRVKLNDNTNVNVVCLDDDDYGARGMR